MIGSVSCKPKYQFGLISIRISKNNFVKSDQTQAFSSMVDQPSFFNLSAYESGDPRIRRVALLCIDSKACICF